MEGSNFLIEEPVVPGAISRQSRTLILFGRVGNGKSAVGNSIIGKKEFVSRISASGVTTECQMKKTSLDDGQVIKVIDTPGLFESSGGADYIFDVLVECSSLAKDGIDGFILVCSIKSRFSTEEEGVIDILSGIFGEDIINYMIIVFTAGDELDMTFPEYLSTCPPSLQRVLQLCKNRSVLFDNKTRDESQRKKQVQQLMSLVNTVNVENGQSCRSEVFERLKHKVKDQLVVTIQETPQEPNQNRGWENDTPGNDMPGDKSFIDMIVALYREIRRVISDFLFKHGRCS